MNAFVVVMLFSRYTYACLLELVLVHTLSRILCRAQEQPSGAPCCQHDHSSPDQPPLLQGAKVSGNKITNMITLLSLHIKFLYYVHMNFHAPVFVQVLLGHI
jgi:hypothetical protein